jgi:hypothetical protein
MMVEHTGTDGRGPSPSRPFLGCWSESLLIQIFDKRRHLGSMAEGGQSEGVLDGTEQV